MDPHSKLQNNKEAIRISIGTAHSRSGYVQLGGGGVGGGGDLSSNFVHQMCHQGGLCQSDFLENFGRLYLRN